MRSTAPIGHFVPRSNNFSWTDAIARFNDRRSLVVYANIFDWFYDWKGNVNPHGITTDILESFEYSQRHHLESTASTSAYLWAKGNEDRYNTYESSAINDIRDSNMSPVDKHLAESRVRINGLNMKRDGAFSDFEYQQDVLEFESQQSAAAYARQKSYA